MGRLLSGTSWSGLSDDFTRLHNNQVEVFIKTVMTARDLFIGVKMSEENSDLIPTGRLKRQENIQQCG